jgi:lauroyl/myristoyl acyltransferase
MSDPSDPVFGCVSGTAPQAAAAAPAPAAAGRRFRRWRAGRRLRRWLRSEFTAAALHLAPQLSEAGVERLAAAIAVCGPRLPLLSRMVADNLRAAGTYSPRTLRQHFAELGHHFAGALQVLRFARRPDGLPKLLEYARRHIELDESVEELARLAWAGHGVILVGPHICNYLVGLALLNERVPLAAYLRRPKDSRRQVARRLWHEISGIRLISESARDGGPLGGLGRLIAALRQPAVVFMTPDLPQKAPSGLPVRLFGRSVRLPAGAGVLAVRTGAPLFMLLARGGLSGRQVLFVKGPFEPPGGSECRRHKVVALSMQWFAQELENFLRDQPALWYFWADKRWTRVFRNDGRYVGKFCPDGSSCPLFQPGG